MNVPFLAEKNIENGFLMIKTIRIIFFIKIIRLIIFIYSINKKEIYLNFEIKFCKKRLYENYGL